MTMNALKSISTIKTDNEKEDTISSCQYENTPTPTDNFNLCYTPTSFANDEDKISDVMANIEISEDKQITNSISNNDKISIDKNAISTDNKSNEDQPVKTKICCLNTLPTTNKNKFMSEAETLLLNGYKKHQFISTTLQGEIYIAKVVNKDNDKENENEYVVIKTANIKLHQNGHAIGEHGRRFNVKENIAKEAHIMKKFMDNNPPNECIKFHAFFNDQQQFYLVMEKGGQGLFEFTVKCHKLIRDKTLSLQKWRKSVRFMFNKMATFVQWLHNKMHCCHLDISLENVIIGNDTFIDEKTGEIKNLDIRIVDFGLSVLFDKNKNSKFKCNEFVGKKGYKAPQIFEKKEFLANKADCWSLGVALFMMLIGAPPYQFPNIFDAAFTLIKDNQIKDLLRNWDRLDYVTDNILDLLSKMLCYNESNRIDINEICNHIWLKK